MHYCFGRRLGAVAVFAGALIVVLPAAALAAPSATKAVTQPSSRTAMVRPGQSHSPGLVARPSYPGSPFNLCLTADNRMCIESNGAGNPVTITSNSHNWSVFTEYAQPGNGTIRSFENGNGNCLRENTSHQVVIANGGCLGSDNDGKWLAVGDGSLNNYQYQSDYMLVYGDDDGWKVWAKPPVSGTWIKWSAEYT